jgi:tRNA modification GTPase
MRKPSIWLRGSRRHSDFPDEGYHFTQPAESVAALTQLVDGIDSLLRDASRGRLIRDGATVVIAGRPNVGKSRLFNVLLGGARAIVTDVPGTTRDMLTERVELGGVLVTLADTAGVRDSNDAVEQVGIGLSRRAMQTADLVVTVLDGSLGNDRRRRTAGGGGAGDPPVARREQVRPSRGAASIAPSPIRWPYLR